MEAGTSEKHRGKMWHGTLSGGRRACFSRRRSCCTDPLGCSPSPPAESLINTEALRGNKPVRLGWQICVHTHKAVHHNVVLPKVVLV